MAKENARAVGAYGLVVHSCPQHRAHWCCYAWVCESNAESFFSRPLPLAKLAADVGFLVGYLSSTIPSQSSEHLFAVGVGVPQRSGVAVRCSECRAVQCRAVVGADTFTPRPTQRCKQAHTPPVLHATETTVERSTSKQSCRTCARACTCIHVRVCVGLCLYACAYACCVSLCRRLCLSACTCASVPLCLCASRPAHDHAYGTCLFAYRA